MHADGTHLPLSLAAFATDPVANAKGSFVFPVLDRALEVRYDAPAVGRYIRGAFGRLAPEGALPTGSDVAELRAVERSAAYAGQRLRLPAAAAESDFTLAFYGISRIVSESLKRNAAWHAFFGAAVNIRGRGVALAAPGGTGKTTLVLGLLERGASLYGDEFVAVRKSDRRLGAVGRTMHLRGPALPFVEQPAVRAYCAVTAPRIAAGGWRAWDFFDPATIYGPEIWAKPAPLEAVVILARAAEGRSRIERVPVTAAAFEVARGLDSDAQGLARVADLATTLAGVAAYRLTVGPDGDAADALIEAVA